MVQGPPGYTTWVHPPGPLREAWNRARIAKGAEGAVLRKMARIARMTTFAQNRARDTSGTPLEAWNRARIARTTTFVTFRHSGQNRHFVTFVTFWRNPGLGSLESGQNSPEGDGIGH